MHLSLIQNLRKPLIANYNSFILNKNMNIFWLNINLIMNSSELLEEFHKFQSLGELLGFITN